MQETFTILGISGYTYGLIIAAGTLLYLCAAGILGYRHELPPGTVRVFGLHVIPLGIVGARLGFCLGNLSTFIQTYENPWLMLRFWDGGLSMIGMLLGFLAAAALTARLASIPYGKLMDILCAPLGLFIAVCRLAEGTTELGVGKVIEPNELLQAFPWLAKANVMGIATEYRMSVWLYEALAALLICAIVLFMRHVFRKKKNMRQGDLALVFFTLYGAVQMVLESLRDDGHMMLIFLRLSQVAAVLMPLLVAFIFSKRIFHICGKLTTQIRLSWALMLLALLTGIIMEFSLDGRFTWGTPSMLRDYLILIAAALMMAAVPCTLLYTLQKTLYPQERIVANTQGLP